MNIDFIPEKVVVGKSSKRGWVSCRYKGQKWTGEGIFTRITGGFKPHLQRDNVKELKKAITASTEEFDNAPTKGFKLVGFPGMCQDGNLYSINEFNNRSNVILEDPRGFNIAISLREFFDLLAESDGTLKSNEFELELCYGWNAGNSRPSLISTKNAKYKKLLEESRKLLAAKDDTEYVTPAKLVAGKVYLNVNDSKQYMYLGKMDVYSLRCQKASFGCGSYEYLELFQKDKLDTTGAERFVFYKLGATGVNNYYTPVNDPYWCKAGISKTFVENTDPIKASKMYDDPTKACTFENIMENVSRNLLFNRIDFAGSKKTESMPPEMFYARYGKEKSVSNIFWPESYFSDYLPVLDRMDRQVVFKVDRPYSSSSNTTGNSVYSISHLKTWKERMSSYYCDERGTMIETFRCKSLSDFYCVFLPRMLVIKLENGKTMLQAQAAGFQKPSFEKGIKGYYSHAV